jgi:hypothetical protein
MNTNNSTSIARFIAGTGAATGEPPAQGRARPVTPESVVPAKRHSSTPALALSVLECRFAGIRACGSSVFDL